MIMLFLLSMLSVRTIACHKAMARNVDQQSKPRNGIHPMSTPSKKLVETPWEALSAQYAQKRDNIPELHVQNVIFTKLIFPELFACVMSFDLGTLYEITVCRHTGDGPNYGIHDPLLCHTGLVWWATVFRERQLICAHQLGGKLFCWRLEQIVYSWAF